MARGKTFTPAEWQKIDARLQSHGAVHGWPDRRSGSLVLSSFNIVKFGGSKLKNWADGNWRFLAAFLLRCDLVAIQEMQDDLAALEHLMALDVGGLDGLAPGTRLGDLYDHVLSDVTGWGPEAKGMSERLCFLYRRGRVEQSGLASDISYDRSEMLRNMAEGGVGFLADLTAYMQAAEAWRAENETILAANEARKKVFEEKMLAWENGTLMDVSGSPATKPPKFPKLKKPGGGYPKLVPKQFLTFLRTPHCVSFRAVDSSTPGNPLTFLAVNAHLVYSDGVSGRKREFSALMKWLTERAQKTNLVHPNIVLLADLNLEFEKAGIREEEVRSELRSLNLRYLTSKKAAKVNFPFITPHPSRNGRHWRTNARKDQTFDHIAFFSRDDRLPLSDANGQAGTSPDGFDYRVFDFVDLVAMALEKKSFDALSGTKMSAMRYNLNRNISDHMPIWVRVPL
jgi:hypothetical protein